MKNVKVYILRTDDPYELENGINKFIKDKEIVDIKLSGTGQSYNTTALIMYKDE